MADIQHASSDEMVYTIDEAAHQIGDSVVALTQPLTEGIIISRCLTDEAKVEVSIIMAPYRRKGHTWTRASVIARDVARLSKRVPAKFMFPIADRERIQTEAKRAKADPTWVFTVLSDLDLKIPDNAGKPGDAMEKDVTWRKDVTDDHNSTDHEDRKYLSLDDRLIEVLSLKDEDPKKGNKKKAAKRDSDTDDSDFEFWRRSRKHKKAHKRRKASRSDSSTSSSSSSSSSDESDKQGEVCEKGDTGLFSCPFHKNDLRGFKDVRVQIKGKSLSRKHVRVALHNLYTECYSLASFADKLVYTASSSPFKPYASDIAWLQLHAKYLDAILLNSLYGAWVLWNESWLDEIVIAFLELSVRVSPYKEFPSCLEEKVRKWMKKRRIGISPRYGPVSYAMQHAKFTDTGLIIAQTSTTKSKDAKSTKQSFPQKTGTKSGPNIGADGDKKLP